MRTTHRNTHNNGGFSFPEVCATIGIISIISSAAIPQMGPMIRSIRLNRAVDEVTLLLAQSKSTSVGTNKRVKVAVEERTMVVFIDENGNGSFDENECVSSRCLEKEYVGITLESQNDIVFYPRGTASANTLTVRDHKESKRITINVAGRISTL